MVIDKKLVRLQDLKDAYDKAANKEDVDNKFIEVDNSLSQLSEQIANLGGGADISVEPAEDDIPKIFFDEAIPQTKDDVVTKFRYISKTLDFE